MKKMMFGLIFTSLFSLIVADNESKVDNKKRFEQYVFTAVADSITSIRVKGTPEDIKLSEFKVCNLKYIAAFLLLKKCAEENKCGFQRADNRSDGVLILEEYGFLQKKEYGVEREKEINPEFIPAIKKYFNVTE